MEIVTALLVLVLILVIPLEVVPYKTSQMYHFHFGLFNNFDFFVCLSVPNKKTPPIMVHIASNALWIEGMKNIFDQSYDVIEKALGQFGLKIDKTQENRVDYAFHTNYFNDLLRAFPEKDLGKMFVGSFEEADGKCKLHTHEEDKYGDREIEKAYFTLGRRKSNNVFLRVYNKTREVIEVGKKQFFIQIWLKYGLINKFDEYCLFKAFAKGSYESLDRARCEFYCDYGTDMEIKREIAQKLNENDVPAKWWTKRAKGLVPAVTIITNVEIETKRKFYDKKNLPIVWNDKSPKGNIYNLIDQMSEIIRFLTDKTIRFVDYKGANAKIHRLKRPMADWWKRLRNAKKVEIIDKWEIEYLHFYQHNLDKRRIEQMGLKKLAKIGVYQEVAEGRTEPKYSDEFHGSHIYHDFEKYFSNLNDNDILKYYDTKLLGHKEIQSKQRVNARNELKRQNRPLPELREKSPVRTFECCVCGETLPEREMAINITETGYGTCIVCLRSSVQKAYV
jgi:hypothetical protein